MKKLLDRARRTPWFIAAGWYCQAVGILLLILLGFHIVRSGFHPATFLSDVTGSNRWMDRVLFATFIIWAVTGMALCFCMPVTQKKTLAVTGSLLLAGFIAKCIPPLSGTGSWLLAAGITSAGIRGALFNRIHGKTEWAVWKASHPEETEPRPQCTAAELKAANPKTRRDPTIHDLAAVLFLLLMIVLLFTRAKSAVRQGNYAGWKFVEIGAIAYVMMLYISSLRNDSTPVSILSCRFLWGITAFMLLLCAAHLFHTGSFSAGILTGDAANMPDRRWWPDHALSGMYTLFSFVSLWLTIYRRETRKAVLMALPVWVMINLITVELGTQPEMSDRSWVQAAGYIIPLLWPLFAGVYALGFERMFGGEVRAERLAKILKDREKKAAEAVLRSAQPAATRAPMSPVRPAPAVRPVSTGAAQPLKPGTAQPVKPSTAQPVKPATVQPPKPGTAQPPRPGAAQSATAQQSAEDREEKLRRLKESYVQAHAAPTRETPGIKVSAAQLLPEAARRIYPGGESLASLNGQRQLLIWLAEGVPCVRPVMKQSSVSALMDPELPDDPNCFLPVLARVLEDVTARLKAELRADSGKWRKMDPEAMTGGWFALKMTERMSSDPVICRMAADEIATRMSERSDAMTWLAQVCGEEEKQ